MQKEKIEKHPTTIQQQKNAKKAAENIGIKEIENCIVVFCVGYAVFIYRHFLTVEQNLIKHF